MKRKAVLILLVVLLIVLGFLREFIFVNTNSVLYSKYYNEDYKIHPFFNFYKSFSYSAIYAGKWILTAFFIIAYFALQYFFCKQLLKDNITQKWLLLFYVFLVILSALTFGIGWIAGSMNQGYTFSRIFLGILQSPLPVMFVLPVHYFSKKLNKN